MSYLEDNAVIARELQGKISLDFVREDNRVGSGNTMETYSAGTFMTSFGLEVPIALKTIRQSKLEEHFAERDRRRFAKSLAFISLMHERLPFAPVRLPLFYVMLINQEGVTIGQVTEDFSEGGEHSVNDYPAFWPNRPAEVNEMTTATEGLLEGVIKEDNSSPFQLRANDDFVSRMLNRVGFGDDGRAVFADLFGEPIEVDPYQKVGFKDRPRVEEEIGKILRVDRVLDELDLHAIQLAA